jgi:hypothetical protein
MDGGAERLITKWFFPPERLALTGKPVDPSVFARSTRTEAARRFAVSPYPGEVPQHFVDGYLDFDPATKIATVTVTGLKEPFETRVDLAEYLRH